ncbi:MAG: hypothetical protein PVF83_02195 [Anaerolineales bacterium]|jgi:hypothetical protein
MPEVSGKYFAYSDLFWGSKTFLKIIDEQQEGALAYYSCISVIVFSAFCLEAYMNHIGPILIKTWENSREDNGEIWLRPKEKIDKICSNLHITPDYGRRPFQSYTDIFVFRNLVAHGATSIIEGNFTDGIPEIHNEIEKKAIPKFAHRYHKDTEGMILFIHNKFNPGDYPFLTISEAEGINE